MDRGGGQERLFGSSLIESCVFRLALVEVASIQGHSPYIRRFSAASDAPNHFCGIAAEHVPLKKPVYGFGGLEPTKGFASLV